MNRLLRRDFFSLNRKSFLSEKGEGGWSGFEENIPEGMESKARGIWRVSERVPSPSFSFVVNKKSQCSDGLSGELEACDQRPLVRGLPPGRGPKGRATGCRPGVQEKAGAVLRIGGWRRVGRSLPGLPEPTARGRARQQRSTAAAGPTRDSTQPLRPSLT